MEKDFNSDYLRGHIDTIILKALFDGEKYGYEICKDVETKSNGTFVLKQPSLYSALKRLEKSGLISSRWQDSDIGGKRHYYKLTDLGIKHFEDSQKEWNYSTTVLDSLLSDTNNSDIQTKNSQPTIENNITQEQNSEIAHNKNENTEKLSDDYLQCNFFENNANNTEQTFFNTPSIEPEITVEKQNKEDNVQKTKEVKNDAEFINETYIDTDNDISFSNNVYLRVKNTIQPAKSEGAVNFIANETISPMNFFEVPKQQIKKNTINNISSYSIKPYTKFNSNTKKSGYLNVNKLILLSLLCVLPIMLIESIGFYFILKNTNNLVSYSSTLFTISYVLSLLFPSIAFVKYIINPNKKTAKSNKKQYLSKSIWFASLSFCVIIINLLINPNCFKLISSYSTLLLPIILLSNIVLFEVMKNILKTNSHVKA